MQNIFISALLMPTKGLQQLKTISLLKEVCYLSTGSTRNAKRKVVLK